MPFVAATPSLLERDGSKRQARHKNNLLWQIVLMPARSADIAERGACVKEREIRLYAAGMNPAKREINVGAEL